jgi:4-oxalocrotonate tautomerase
MPILNVKVSATPSTALSQEIGQGLTELTSRVLRKNPELTAVTVQYVPQEHWIVAGRSLAEHGKHGFYLDIKVVDGTNTKDEKAEYVARAFDFFARLLGDIHPESYVYVEDVQAHAYGFGGKTQEHRYVRAQLERSPTP